MIYYDNFKNSQLKRLVTGGEKLNISNIEKRNYIFVDEYGPTENTVTSTVKYIRSIEDTQSIGRPLGNVKVYIVDQNNNLCPIGVPGEICLSGNQLAKGYWNNPELTKNKFVDNPFNKNLDASCNKMYHTGDLAKWLPNGEIQFLGRVDFQVKIRGFRIELGEIEVAMAAIDTINEAIVTTKKDPNGKDYLAGYFVADEQIDVAWLKQALQNVLPEYMIPQYLIQLKTMPLNSNGKVDRKKLPEPVFVSEEYIPATNNEEQLLIKLWSEVLGIDQKKISINNNYFHMGGDSIKVIQFVSKLRKQGYSIKAKEIFQYPTVRELATIIKNRNSTMSISQEKATGSFGLIPIQKWFFEQN